MLDHENDPSSLWNHCFPLGICLYSHRFLLEDQDENSSGRVHVGGVCIHDEYHFTSLLAAFPM